MQEPVIELLNRGQVDKVKHGEGRRKQAEGPTEHRTRRALHIQTH